MIENQTLLEKAKEYAQRNDRYYTPGENDYENILAAYLAGSENNGLKWVEILDKVLTQMIVDREMHMEDAKNILNRVQEMMLEFPSLSPVNEQREKEVEGLQKEISEENKLHLAWVDLYNKEFLINKSLEIRVKELEEALQGLVNDVKRKPNNTRYATHIKKAEQALKQAK